MSMKNDMEMSPENDVKNGRKFEVGNLFGESRNSLPENDDCAELAEEFSEDKENKLAAMHAVKRARRTPVIYDWDNFAIGDVKTFRNVTRNQVWAALYRYKKKHKLDWKVSIRTRPRNPGPDETCEFVWVRRLAELTKDQLMWERRHYATPAEPVRRPWWKIADGVWEFAPDMCWLTKRDRMDVLTYQKPDNALPGTPADWKWRARVPDHIKQSRRGWETFEIQTTRNLGDVSIESVRKDISKYCLIRNLAWRIRIARVRDMVPASVEVPIPTQIWSTIVFRVK